MPQVNVSRALLFVAASVALAYVSRRPLAAPRSHGFPRFFAWECMVALLLLDFVSLEQWFADPLSLRQLASWVLLVGSIVPAVLGGLQLLRQGRPDPRPEHDASLFGFEKTTALVTTGVYRYVRHPLYGSLLLLTWGVFLKRPSWPGVVLALAASILLTVTARREEGENVAFFGDAYRAYMRHSTRFIPFVF